MSTSLLYQAFGIRGYQYVRTDYRDGQAIFTIRQQAKACRCPACGVREIGGENGPMWTCPECRSVMKDSRVICGSCGTLVRPGAMVCVPLFLAFLACLVVGIVLFPDAPIRQVGETYVGKGDHPHTAEDYRWSRRWESVHMVTGIVAALSSLYAAAEYYRLTGSLRRPTGKGTEVWRKPQGRRDAR